MHSSVTGLLAHRTGIKEPTSWEHVTRDLSSSEGCLPTKHCPCVLCCHCQAHLTQRAEGLHHRFWSSCLGENKTPKSFRSVIFNQSLLSAAVDWRTTAGFRAKRFQLRTQPYNMRVMTSNYLLFFCLSTYKHTANSTVFHLARHWWARMPYELPFCFPLTAQEVTSPAGLPPCLKPSPATSRAITSAFSLFLDPSLLTTVPQS